MRRVFDWIDATPAAFESIGGFAINVSPLSVSNPQILGFLHERLARPDAPARADARVRLQRSRPQAAERIEQRIGQRAAAQLPDPARRQA